MIIKLTGATKGAENIEKIEAELSEMAQSLFFFEPLSTERINFSTYLY
jgi:hypothetical protein